MVHFNLRGFDLELPTSHDLPYLLRDLPEYSMNIGRIARGIGTKYRKMSMVDIGANIGDTAAIVRSVTHCPILCIEGNERYFSVLARNARVIGSDIELENVFVGQQSAAIDAHLSSSGGTARLVPGAPGAGHIQLERLSDILARHARFQDAKLLKIDTDGFDIPILESELDWLSKASPVLFFEYDPFFFPGGPAPSTIFDHLLAAGYRSAMIYENFGDYLVTLRLDQVGQIQDIHSFFEGRRGLRYADICLFSGADDELCSDIRSQELAYFKRTRPSPETQ